MQASHSTSKQSCLQPLLYNWKENLWILLAYVLPLSSHVSARVSGLILSYVQTAVNATTTTSTYAWNAGLLKDTAVVWRVNIYPGLLSCMMKMRSTRYSGSQPNGFSPKCRAVDEVQPLSCLGSLS
jgi:hypothetical protein